MSKQSEIDQATAIEAVATAVLAESCDSLSSLSLLTTAIGMISFQVLSTSIVTLVLYSLLDRMVSGNGVRIKVEALKGYVRLLNKLEVGWSHNRKQKAIL